MKEIFGNILMPAGKNAEHGTVVCHQVNCQGVMGAGLAKQIREKYPAVFEAYAAKCGAADEKQKMLGNVQCCSVLKESGYIIANIFGQYYYGRTRRHTDYDALRTAFEKIARAFPNDTIRIPYKIGCRLAGGDWDVVYGIICEVFKDHPGVEIWKFTPEEQ